MTVISGTSALKSAQGEYDFAVDGGAVSTITLRQGGGNTLPNVIPAGAIILEGWIEVDTLVTTASGNTGTVAVNSEAAGDLLAAAITSGAPWSTTGRKSIIPVSTGATTVKTTVSRSLAITVATAAITAGKFRVVVYYR
jgi:hypothetical protein